jgi:transposase
MRIIHRRCAGLDVHKKSVSACIRLRVHGHKIETQEAVFGTFTQDLERLRDWLKQHKVKQVAMESTGVYWIPVWNVLEPVRLRFELMLVNPQIVRALRGNKTDRIDANRIAEFLQYGLLRGSFVPPRPIRELRDLTRRRVHLQQDRNRVVNRITRILETVNVKLSSVASNVVGKSGRAILHAIVAGRSQPEHLAELALGRLQEKKTELALALAGRYSGHFRWLLQQLLQELEWFDSRLLELDARLRERMRPHQDVVERLCSLPGVDELTAWVLLAELGSDAQAFPTAAQAASWAGLCPGNCESAGKRQSGRTRKGDRYLRRVLIQNAWAVSHKKNCFLTALFYRVAARRGPKRAALAVAHRLLVLAYHIIRSGSVYREVGDNYYDQLHPERTAHRLTQRLQRIGFDVVITPRAPGSAPQPPCNPKRGRPCLCAARGITCLHQARPADAPTARAKARSATPPVAPDACPRCANWRIPCIHIRNQKLHGPNPSSTAEP